MEGFVSGLLVTLSRFTKSKQKILSSEEMDDITGNAIRLKSTMNKRVRWRPGWMREGR